VTAFFSWVDRCFRASLAGRAASSSAGAWRRVASESLAVKALWPPVKMAFVPCGEQLSVETFLGLSLAVACVAPTEMVFLAGAFTLAAFLRDRSGRLTGTLGAGEGDEAGSQTGPAAGGQSHSAAVGEAGGRAVDASGTARSTLWAFPGFGTVLAVAAVLIFLVGATVSSVDPGKSLYNLVIWTFYLLFFFMAADASLRGRAESVIWPFLAGATFSGLVGIHQKMSGWRPARSWLDKSFEEEIVRMVGTFSNPTFYAEMLGLALPITMALILKKKDWRDRLVLLGFAGVQSVAMVLTYSRGAWLGLIFSFCVVAVLYERRLLLLGLAAGALGLAVAPHVLLERLVSSFSLTDSSNAYRMFIWRGSLAMLKANLVRGIGLGAESFSKVYPEYMIIQTPAPHAHSTYLEMLIEIGLFGFLAMAWLLLVWTFDVLRAVFRQKGAGGARWAKIGILSGVAGAISGHLLQGMIEYTWYSPRVTIAFWALMGIGAGIAASRQRGLLKDGVQAR